MAAIACNASHGRYYFLNKDLKTEEKIVGQYEAYNAADTRQWYCPNGYACSPLTQACTPCFVGQYCPNRTIQDKSYVLNNLCPEGYECPNTYTKKKCPAGFACGVGTAKHGSPTSPSCGDIADGSGVYCPQGTEMKTAIFFPNDNFCEEGKYCPTEYNGTKQIQCPEGSYCYAKVAQPLRCGKGELFGIVGLTFKISHCNPGTASPIPNFAGVFMAIIVLAIFVVLVLILLFFIRFRRYLQMRQHKKKLVTTGKHNLVASLTMGFGQLSQLQMQDMSGKDTSNMFSKHTAMEVFRSIDRKKTGYVTQEALSQYFEAEVANSDAVLPHNYKEKLNDKITEIWQQYDSDKSGSLDKEQFSKYFESLQNVVERTGERAMSSGEVTFKGFKEKPRSKRYEFKFSRLGLKLKGSNRTVLKGVSGKFRHSQLIAVMGPSGAGKSTFLNTICGRAFYGFPTGEVLMNGKEDTIRNHQSEVGFVPQDDTVFETLTVYENFMFSVALRQPEKTERERELVVEDVIQLLELDHVRDIIVGSVDKRGISGGQRKRVNIGLELVADPSILFLDEPTSGLDSTSAKIVMSALKDLANLGMTVIAVIHQPRYSIFALFDHLLLLGKGGMTVFSGPTLVAETYFESIGFKCPPTENVADFLMDVCAGIIPRQDDDEFVPEKLFDIWNTNGSRSVDQFSAKQANAKGELQSTTAQKQVRKMEKKTISPAQLQTYAKRCTTFMHIEGKHLLQGNDLVDVLDICGFSSNIEREFERTLGVLFEDEKNYNLDEVKSKLTKHIKSANLRLKKIRGDRLRSVVQDRQMFAKFMKENNSKENPKKKKSKQRLDEQDEISSSKPTLSNEALSPIAFWKQYKWLQYRYFLIQVKTWRTLSQDLLAAAIAGFICGGVSIAEEFQVPQYPAIVTLTLTLLGVLVSVGAVNTFGSTKLLFFRERGWGLNAFAYFLSRILVDIGLQVLKGSLFASVYYDLARPLFDRSTLILICVSVAYAAAPWGYIVSIVSNKQNAVILTACASFVFGGLTAGVKPNLKEVKDAGGLVEAIFSLSFGRWGVESIISQWMLGAPEPYWTEATEFLDKKSGFVLKSDTVDTNVRNLIVLGTVFRILTYVLLVTVDRNKQNKETVSAIVKASIMKGKSSTSETEKLKKELEAVKNLLHSQRENRAMTTSRRGNLRKFRSYENAQARKRQSALFLSSIEDMDDDAFQATNPMLQTKPPAIGVERV